LLAQILGQSAGNAAAGSPRLPAMGAGYGAPAPAPAVPASAPPLSLSDKLGTVGSILLNNYGNGAGAPFMQQLQQRRQAQLAQQQALAARFAPQHVGENIIHLDPATGRYVTDWSPPTSGPAPTEIERLAQAAGYIPGTPEYQTILRNAVNDKTDPAQIVAMGNGQFQAVRHSQLYGQPAVSPPPPVGTVDGGYRFKGGNPSDPSAWEPVGGASPSGSRTFR